MVRYFVPGRTWQLGGDGTLRGGDNARDSWFGRD